MGKRKPRGGLSGLSQFVLDAFKQDDLVPAPDVEESVVGNAKLDEELLSNQPPPTKRRKTHANHVEEPGGYSGSWVTKHDATSLVPHYTDASQVPDHLQKYFSQRYRYFSQYSTPPGCLLDEEGWYSITPELVANQIAERCRCGAILDAFCGVGGNAIAFAQTCERVIALDTSPTRLSLARHNAQIYGVADRIEFILADYISFANSYISSQGSNTSRKIDVVFLSPPWGGPSYLSGTPPESVNEPGASGDGIPETTPTGTCTSYSLASIRPIDGAELFRLTRKITPNIAYYLPRNTRLEQISGLLEVDGEDAAGVSESLVQGKEGKHKGKKEELEMVEVEEEWMGSKLKALTCYFGGLAAGQEARFDG